MMIDPPIDLLIKKAECRYALVCGVAKRAKQLMTQEEEGTSMTGEKALSIAAKEIYDGKMKVVHET